MPLEGHLDVDAEVDDGAEFAFTVTNGGTEPIELTFRSSLIVDFVVFDDTETVWRWSEGQTFAQALVTEVLAPGESFTETGTWVDPPPGEYTVRAALDTVDHDLTDCAEFCIES